MCQNFYWIGFEMDYKKIQKEIEDFVKERDWDQFHSPKNLAMALSVEASELVEIFQWQEKDDYKLQKFKEKTLSKSKDEVADIFYYLIRICNKMDIDLEKVFNEKMEKNKNKYPITKFKGQSTKYNDL